MQEVQIRNLAGAGDSFGCGFVVKYLETNDIDKSIEFANEVATIIIQKRGVATV